MKKEFHKNRSLAEPSSLHHVMEECQSSEQQEQARCVSLEEVTKATDNCCKAAVNDKVGFPDEVYAYKR